MGTDRAEGRPSDPTWIRISNKQSRTARSWDLKRKEKEHSRHLKGHGHSWGSARANRGRRIGLLSFWKPPWLTGSSESLWLLCSCFSSRGRLWTFLDLQLWPWQLWFVQPEWNAGVWYGDIAFAMGKEQWEIQCEQRSIKRRTPLVESRLFSPFPPRLQRVLEHFVAGIHADHVKTLLYQHNGVDSATRRERKNRWMQRTENDQIVKQCWAERTLFLGPKYNLNFLTEPVSF